MVNFVRSFGFLKMQLDVVCGWFQVNVEVLRGDHVEKILVMLEPKPDET